MIATMLLTVRMRDVTRYLAEGWRWYSCSGNCEYVTIAKELANG